MIKPVLIPILCFVMAAIRALPVPMPAEDVKAHPLETVLARSGRFVALFWKQVASVTCTEEITQQKLGIRGNIEHQQKSTFDYLMLTRIQDADPGVDESRILKKAQSRQKDFPLLTTSGFSSLMLVFHPAYQGSFRYQLAGEEPAAGKAWVRIQFEHIPGTRSTMALSLSGRVHPLDLRGSAWIDPETGAIGRISAELKQPMQEINLRAFYTKVEYEPLRFSSVPGMIWLPVTAAIDVETSRQHWRNTHRFSGYRRFSVTTDESVSK